MISRPKEPSVDTNDPFKDDEFERKILGEGLVNLLGRMEGPLTLALTGPYGSGKTHFLTRCKALMEKREIPVVLINAWETDFATEPLAPLVSELTEKFASKLKDEKKIFRNIKTYAAKIGAAMIPLALKLATAGILYAEDFTQGSAVADAVQKVAEEQFQRFAAAKASIQHLRDELAKLSEKIRPNGDTRPPVVVIVDELDRCRPTYAIELLEVVKHLFNIPGIVFILGVDRNQLASSASAIFGAGIDADGYLRRFIDLECALPEPDLERYCTNSASRIIRGATGIELQNIDVGLWLAIGELATSARFSVRKTNQLLTTIGIAISAARSQMDDPQSVALLAFMRDWNSDLYGRFVKKQVRAWEVFEKLRALSPRAMEYNSSWRQESPFIWTFAMAGQDDPDGPFLDKYRQQLTASGKPTNTIDWLEQHRMGRWPKFLETIAKFVEFGAGFIAR
jgi:hypothetical protein